MKIKSKKGFQLSINFIVILIIAIVVFGFGIIFVTRLFEGITKVKVQLDEETEKELDELFDKDETLSIPRNSKTINVGKSEVFGLGILNILGDNKEFTIDISCTSTIKKAGETMSEQERNQYCERPEDKNWVFEDHFEEFIKNNERKKIPIFFQVPTGTPPGTYIFTITVSYDTTIYDTPEKIYIKVE